MKSLYSNTLSVAVSFSPSIRERTQVTDVSMMLTARLFHMPFHSSSSAFAADPYDFLALR